MTIEQPDLFGDDHLIAHTGKPLTEKQQRGYQLVKTSEDGITADELGAIEHERRGKHHRDTRCQFCASEGKGVLDSVALRPLVVKRRVSGRYELRVAPVPVVHDVEGLPGESFEDMFNGSEAA